MKKKKNHPSQTRQTLLVGLFVVSLAFLFLSIVLISPFFFQRDPNAFTETRTSLGGINPIVATLLEGTSIAATEQFVLTSTARP